MHYRTNVRLLFALLVGSSLCAGCDSGVSTKTTTATEGHDGKAHGQVTPPAATPNAAHVGPTR